MIKYTITMLLELPDFSPILGREVKKIYSALNGKFKIAQQEYVQSSWCLYSYWDLKNAK
jgi:hypothetical protein